GLIYGTSYAAEESYTRVTGVRLAPTDLEVRPDQPGWSIAAEFDIKLSNKLNDAANRGLPLNFVVDFRLIKPRWYWTDQELVVKSYPMVLSYNALTRSYRVETPTGNQTTPDLQSALNLMSRLSEWPVVLRSQIQIGETYLAQVRFRLDVAEMPKPFQINALTNSQWILSSDWLEFEFTPRSESAS
ncbi:MAG: DUF4390 domain-containing protein, partial [Limnobacter sp.]|nr:DUF4390 domain-containing protein [Limnobacter sp.]